MADDAGTRPAVTGRPRQMLEAERRRQLIAAAADLFLHKGYHATTMDDVARCAGMSKKTVYQVFSSKAELFDALLSDWFAPFAAPIEAPLEIQPEPTGAAIAEASVPGGVEGGIVNGIFGSVPAVVEGPPPPPPPVPQGPVRLGGQLSAPALVKRVEPVYPAIAQAAAIDGVVSEEIGGPFVVTSAADEFAHDIDAANPPDAEREPLPRPGAGLIQPPDEE